MTGAFKTLLTRAVLSSRHLAIDTLDEGQRWLLFAALTCWRCCSRCPSCGAWWDSCGATAAWDSSSRRSPPPWSFALGRSRRCARLGRRLGPRFLHAHHRTLRRCFLSIPAELYLLGTDRLLVVLRVKRLRSLWEALIRHANRDPVRIPWLQNRKLLLALWIKKSLVQNRQGAAVPRRRGPGFLVLALQNP